MAGLYKKGNKYYAEFYDRTRQPKKKYVPLKTGNRRAAKIALANLEVDYAKGIFDPWNPEPESLEITSPHKALQAFLKTKEGLSSKTISMYSHVLGLFVGSLPSRVRLATIRPTHIQDFLNERDLNDTSKDTYFRQIRTFFRWCKREKLVEKDPASEVNLPKPPKVFPYFLSPDEVERLLTCIRGDACRKAQPTVEGQISWLVDVIQVAVFTGLRLGELVNLRWADVDLQNKHLLVRNTDTFKTKTRAERVVPIVASGYDTLSQMYRQRDPHEVYVFLGVNGDKLNGEYVSERFRFYRRLAGLPEEIHFHSLRHTCASWLASQGVPLPVIQQILGHTSIAMTMRYAHLSPDTIKNEMVQAFDSLMNAA